MAERTFNFGKIDYYGRGKDVNLVSVNVRLTNNKHGFPVFSASIDVWNPKHSGIVLGGQAFEDIPKVPENNALYQEIKRLWKKYHLNDTHAGTKVQEEALKRAKLKGASHYSEAVEFLKRKGLYEVKLTPTEKKYNPQFANSTYKYGHGWIYYPIPAADLAKIKRIMNLPRGF